MVIGIAREDVEDQPVVELYAERRRTGDKSKP
jgi:hypothetical protein